MGAEGNFKEILGFDKYAVVVGKVYNGVRALIKSKAVDPDIYLLKYVQDVEIRAIKLANQSTPEKERREFAEVMLSSPPFIPACVRTICRVYLYENPDFSPVVDAAMALNGAYIADAACRKLSYT